MHDGSPLSSRVVEYSVGHESIIKIATRPCSTYACSKKSGKIFTDGGPC